MASGPDDLLTRAKAAGVATSYVDWAGRTVDVDPAAIAAVLAQRGDRPTRPTPPELTSGTPLPLPPRCWGWSVQLYAMHSAGSWGIGDLADLRELAVSELGERLNGDDCGFGAPAQAPSCDGDAAI